MLFGVPNPPATHTIESLIVPFTPGEWATLDRAGQLLFAPAHQREHVA
jgi:hypothetical protein